MDLGALTTQLHAFAAGVTSREALETWIAGVLAADALDVERSESGSWEHSPDETRLFWRLIYQFETGRHEDAAARRLATRILRCLSETGSAALTHELLPLLLDQDRLCAIVGKHDAGIISRTSFLSVIAESGYPPHVKLWLEHASTRALRDVCTRLAEHDYGTAAGMLERAPH